MSDTFGGCGPLASVGIALEAACARAEPVVLDVRIDPTLDARHAWNVGRIDGTEETFVRVEAHREGEDAFRAVLHRGWGDVDAYSITLVVRPGAPGEPFVLLVQIAERSGSDSLVRSGMIAIRRADLD